MRTGARLAYLLSQFPAINHTYLLREIKLLRSLGVDLHLASISSPDRPRDQLSLEERHEADQTVYIKALGIRGAVKAHLVGTCTHPAGYLRGLLFSLTAGRGNWRCTIDWFFYFVEAVIVGHWMEKNGLDHVHTHFSSNVALIAAKIFPITISVSIHGYGELAEDPVGFFLAEKAAAAIFIRTVSKYGRSQLMRLCSYLDWDKIEWSPLGVDPSEFRPRPFRATPSPFELLCVGRLSSEKGQHVLIRAMRRIVEQYGDVRLHMVGNGPDRPDLEHEVKALDLGHHVLFHGWMDQARLRGLYERADAVVLPSFVEGIPVVLMEAMAMEIPCIATQITGIPELIRNGVDGILVTASDHEQLADAILSLIRDSGLRAALGRTARQRILRDYDLRRNMQQLAEMFERRLALAGQSSYRHIPRVPQCRP
jgi:glycosyltransferase involved in cell wall biosynthesis